MGWFIIHSWDRFLGWQLTAIPLIYAGLFVLAGSRVWRKSMYRVPDGLLITIAVCMTPLPVYGVERQLQFVATTRSGSYTHFHPLINASWVGMEVGTVLAALVALRYFKFRLLQRRRPTHCGTCLWTSPASYSEKPRRLFANCASCPRSLVS